MSNEVVLTADEVESLLDWLETDLICDIRDNDEVDSLDWLANIMSIYKKCKEAQKEA